MKINKAAIDIIRSNVTNISVETGGIMGSKNGLQITDIIMDIDVNNKYRCRYIPNVNYLNQCIAEWEKQNIYFSGMFHTHFFNIKTLSNEDIKYINIIMNAMPDRINQLFFPIYIIPQHEMICYKATKISGNISINHDILEII